MKNRLQNERLNWEVCERAESKLKQSSHGPKAGATKPSA